MTELIVLPAADDTDVEVEHRLKLIRGDASHDDLMVALGLIAAGMVELHDRAGERLDPGDPASVENALERAGDHRAFMYDLWYRMKIPFGEAALDSWYVLALALARTGGDLPAALTLHCTVLQRLAGDEHDASTVFAEEFGLSAPPVVMRDDTDAEALVSAVLSRSPLDLRAARPWRVSARERARAAWTDMRQEERPVLLFELRQRIEALEQVRFFVDGELLYNKEVAAALRQCTRSDPRGWGDGQLALATIVWMWREAGFCLQELNQSILSLPHVFEFVARRILDYERVLEIPAGEFPDGPLALARMLSGLRVKVERNHLRSLQFDGGNWERREFLVPRSWCAEVLPVPTDLRSRLELAFGAGLSGDGPQLWAEAVDAALAAGKTPTDVIKELAQWSADDTALPVDYAIYTTPIGVKLDTPWEFMYEDVFSYTAFNSKFDRDSENVPFDPVRICNAIGQRMRYNVVKKAQNYTLLRRFKAQSFNLPDIAIAEDAHHGGHQAAGIRMSCRVPTYINHDGITWKGLADIRLNRTHYTRHLEFRPSDIPLANRYAEWLGWIADATYARGLVFDAKYGKKLTSME
jgi:hypothetical protein